MLGCACNLNAYFCRSLLFFISRTGYQTLRKHRYCCTHTCTHVCTHTQLLFSQTHTHTQTQTHLHTYTHKKPSHTEKQKRSCSWWLPYKICLTCNYKRCFLVLSIVLLLYWFVVNTTMNTFLKQIQSRTLGASVCSDEEFSITASFCCCHFSFYSLGFVTVSITWKCQYYFTHVYYSHILINLHNCVNVLGWWWRRYNICRFWGQLLLVCYVTWAKTCILFSRGTDQ